MSRFSQICQKGLCPSCETAVQATIQGALGATPLMLIQSNLKQRPNFEQYEVWGEDILHATALSIIFTAPIGLLVVALLGPHWLHRVILLQPFVCCAADLCWYQFFFAWYILWHACRSICPAMTSTHGVRQSQPCRGRPYLLWGLLLGPSLIRKLSNQHISKHHQQQWPGIHLLF